MLTFGPVPSRRLGHSLGINNIPSKYCSYACAYCQLGRPVHMQAHRQAFFPADAVVAEVTERVAQLRAAGEPLDYLTFVANGEPTLDAGLGEEIARLKPLGVPVAVISNASLISLPAVREALLQADWVSLKVDSVDERTWRRLDRPHGRLELPRILAGFREFAGAYAGELATETMLVEGVNAAPEQVGAVAEFLEPLAPAVAYLAIPTRPPAEPWAVAPGEETLNACYQRMHERLPQVEYLIGYEGNAFSSTGDAEADLLSITAVHPMREDAVRELLGRSGAGWAVVLRLLADGRLVEASYGEWRYYLRRPAGRRAH